MQPLRIVSTGLALLSLLLLLLALGSNHWLVGDISVSQGLWKFCHSSVCLQVSTQPDFIDATKAFLFLAMFAGGVSSVAVITSFLRSHLGPVSLTLVSAVGSFSAGLCAMIAMAVYTGKSTVLKTAILGQPIIWSFGWSFGLGWASFPLFLITGALTMFIPKPPSS